MRKIKGIRLTAEAKSFLQCLRHFIMEAYQPIALTVFVLQLVLAGCVSFHRFISLQPEDKNWAFNTLVVDLVPYSIGVLIIVLWVKFVPRIFESYERH